MLGPLRFRLVGETHDLVRPAWNDRSWSALWRYNVHYFDDLNAEETESRGHWHRELLRAWVDDNPTGCGTGWMPYPTSLRIVNWIKWSLGGNALPHECLASLAAQARWLNRRVEYHLLGNHLFTNAKALVFAGAFFEGQEAEAWLRRGTGIIHRQLPEQILADGGHFERSPMYHSLALEDLLDLCNLADTFAGTFAHTPSSERRSPQAEWRSRVEPMRGWLAAMCHPDGEIGFFNDAAPDVAPSPILLEKYAIRLGFRERAPSRHSVTQLRESGYIRLEVSDAVALLDVAPVGPDYLPAHAHADTLSFELSLFGARTFVNSGTSEYGAGATRTRERGTASHNTVVIDGEDSSEVWSEFRVARRAHPHDLDVVQGDAICVACSHDGYRWLAGRPRHTRSWTLEQNKFEIVDRISGSFRHAEARFHLHPEISVVGSGLGSPPRNAVKLRVPGGSIVAFRAEGGHLRVEPAEWSAGFGRRVKSHCLVVELRGAEVVTVITWPSSQ